MVVTDTYAVGKGGFKNIFALDILDDLRPLT